MEIDPRGTALQLQEHSFGSSGTVHAASHISNVREDAAGDGGHSRTALVRIQPSQMVTVNVTEESCKRRILQYSAEEIHCE